MIAAVRALMDDYGCITFTTDTPRRSCWCPEYFEEAFADAEPGPDLDFLRAVLPYMWARRR